MIPSKNKVCKERDLKAMAYVEKQTGNVIGVAVKDRVKEIALDHGVSIGMREILNKAFNSADLDVCYDNHKKEEIHG